MTACAAWPLDRSWIAREHSMLDQTRSYALGAIRALQTDGPLPDPSAPETDCSTAASALSDRISPEHRNSAFARKNRPAAGPALVQARAMARDPGVHEDPHARQTHTIEHVRLHSLPIYNKLLDNLQEDGYFPSMVALPGPSPSVGIT
jgi:hypothetical protein